MKPIDMKAFLESQQQANTMNDPQSDGTDEGSTEPRCPVWPDDLRCYLRQQIVQAGSAEERADAIRLAQRLVRA